MHFGCTEFVTMGKFGGTFLVGVSNSPKMQEGFEASENKHLDFEQIAGISGNKT